MEYAPETAWPEPKKVQVPEVFAYAKWAKAPWRFRRALRSRAGQLPLKGVAHGNKQHNWPRRDCSRRLVEGVLCPSNETGSREMAGPLLGAGERVFVFPFGLMQTRPVLFDQ
jgi:hypothetical protein